MNNDTMQLKELVVNLFPLCPLSINSDLLLNVYMHRMWGRPLWRPKNNSVNRVLSFHFYVGF